MVDIIRGDKQLAELTKRYRITHQREYKSQCYCFSVTCVFQGGKAKKDIIEVTGIGFSDFDHVPKEKLAELCAKLREDRHTLFFHITASGEGLRVLYRYEMKTGMTLEEQMKFYPTAFLHGNQYFSDLLGVEYDEHCCNLGRLMGAAYDPDAFFRPDAEPFSYEWLVARQQEKTLQDNSTARLRRELKKIDRLYEDKLAKELEHEMKTYVAGSKNEYVSCLAYKLNAFGFSADAALARKGKAVSHCIVYGVFCAALGIEEEETLYHYLYAQTSAMVTNCVKTIPLSQSAGQQLLSGCYPEFAEILEEIRTYSEDDLCLSAPGFDIRGIQHEKLYSRLYMS